MRTSIVAAVLGCALGIGCGGDKGAGGGGGGGAGGGGGGGSLVGAWTLDMDASMAEAKKAIETAKKEALAKATTAEEKQQVEAMFAMAPMGLEMMKNMKMDIVMKSGGDATFEVSAMGQNQSATGTWEEKGGKVILKAKTMNGKPAEQEDPMELTREGDRLVAEMGEGGGKVVLKRK